MNRLTAVAIIATLIAVTAPAVAGTSSTTPPLTPRQTRDLQARLGGPTRTGGTYPSFDLHCTLLAAELAIATAACVVGDAFACASAVLLGIEFANDCTAAGNPTTVTPS